MAMGRAFSPPEEAESWGEFHARLEIETSSLGSPLALLWWVVAALLFAATLFSCAYAVQEKNLGLWLCMLVSLGALGAMAARAVERADRRRARAIELRQLQDAWLDHLAHLDRRSPTL
jgi:ABC-type transport system involved in cytochrome bd biosynthesis fused ATPase/permease subunit